MEYREKLDFITAELDRINKRVESMEISRSEGELIVGGLEVLLDVIESNEAGA